MYHQVPQQPPPQIWTPPPITPQTSDPSSPYHTNNQYETNVHINPHSQDAQLRMRPHNSPQSSNALPLSSSVLSNPLVQFGLNTYGTQLRNRLPGLFGWKTTFSPFFHVNHSYVLQKLKILLLPFTHQHWSRQRLEGWPDPLSLSGAHGSAIQLQAQQAALALDASGNGFKTPAQDINAPDLYIPMMGFITLVLLLSLRTAQMKETFDPELIGKIAMTLAFWICVELGAIYAGLTVISQKQSINSVWDLLSYCCYAFVHCIIITVISLLIESSLLYYVTLFGLSSMQSLFVMRTMKRTLTPTVEQQSSFGAVHSKRLNTFLIFCGFLQIVFCWLACAAA